MGNDFGSLLSLKRKKLGYSLESVARPSGISRSALFYFEKGLSYPGEETLKKITSILNINQKTAFALLKKQKEERKVLMGARRHFGLTSAKYPHLRKLLIDTYLADKNSIRTYNMIEELKKYPQHPFEKEIFNVIIKIFTKVNLIEPDVGGHELLDEKNNKLKEGLKKIGFSWTQNALNEEILIFYYPLSKTKLMKQNKIILKREWRQN